MRRFETGLAHFVFDVSLKRGGRAVIRTTAAQHSDELAGGVFWHPRLQALDIPVPELIAYDLEAPWPYMILERLPGEDLGFVYTRLSPDQRRELAYQIAGIQDRVADLPQADSFGWLTSYEPASKVTSWWEAATMKLMRSRPRLEAAQSSAEHVDRVLAHLAPFESHMRSLPPLPFLDDTTTKNVIVHNGQLSGIVDTDSVCFGDRLYVLALTQMAMLGDQAGSEYIDHWAAAWQLNAFDHRLVNAYTAVHCIEFITETAQQFRNAYRLPDDDQRLTRLESILDRLLLNPGK